MPFLLASVALATPVASLDGYYLNSPTEPERSVYRVADMLLRDGTVTWEPWTPDARKGTFVPSDTELTFSTPTRTWTVPYVVEDGVLIFPGEMNSTVVAGPIGLVPDPDLDLTGVWVGPPADPVQIEPTGTVSGVSVEGVWNIEGASGGLAPVTTTVKRIRVVPDDPDALRVASASSKPSDHWARRHGPIQMFAYGEHLPMGHADVSGRYVWFGSQGSLVSIHRAASCHRVGPTTWTVRKRMTSAL